MSATDDIREFSLGEWDPYFDTKALGRMAIYDDLRSQGDTFFSERFEGFWVMTRAELIREVLQNPTLFSSTATQPADPHPAYAWIPLHLDPPRHTQWRQLLGPHFAPAAIEKLEPKVRSRCVDLVTSIASRGECDFMADFAREYPTTIFMGLMGLPVEEAPQFMVWEDAIVNYSTESDPDMSKMMKAMYEVNDYFAVLLEERRKNPSDDLVSAALTWKLDGEPIPDPDLLGMCVLMFMAGLDTVTQQLGYSFLHLATHDDDRRRVANDPAIIPSAIEELIRYYATVTPGRRVMEDTSFHGCPMKKDQIVFMPLVAGTRDSKEFADADKVDFDRVANHHMAFGAGPHRCVGSHLARRELRIAFEEWHKLVPDYRLAPGFDASQITEHSGGGVFGIDRLHLVWDPVA
jgi:cytochrome P450